MESRRKKGNHTRVQYGIRLDRDDILIIRKFCKSRPEFTTSKLVRRVVKILARKLKKEMDYKHQQNRS